MAAQSLRRSPVHQSFPSILHTEPPSKNPTFALSPCPLEGSAHHTLTGNEDSEL